MYLNWQRVATSLALSLILSIHIEANAFESAYESAFKSSFESSLEPATNSQLTSPKKVSALAHSPQPFHANSDNQQSSNDSDKLMPDTYIVRLRDSANNQKQSAKGIPSKREKWQRRYDQQEQFALQLQKLDITKEQVTRQFTKAVNAISVSLTPMQAKLVQKLPEVAQIEKARNFVLQQGSAHIGVTTLRQRHSDIGVKGEGLVVAVLDSGIDSQHPAFSALATDNYQHRNPNGKGQYFGECSENSELCNDKLLGVFSDPDIAQRLQKDGKTPGQDYHGHGTHVASTVAGNPITIDEQVTEDVAVISGVAPRANIVSFQVCDSDGVCPLEAILQAIEQAIELDVDVINMSIAGDATSTSPWNDLMQLAFLSAHQSGIFVALPAGNLGEGSGGVSHLAPWTMTVANATHGESLNKRIFLWDLADAAQQNLSIEIAGIGPWDESIQGHIVQASNIRDWVSVRQCDFNANVFAEIKGNIVVCEDGYIPVWQKVKNVASNGGVGVILVNSDNNSISASMSLSTLDIPAIYLSDEQSEQLLAWLSESSAPKARITCCGITSDHDWKNQINPTSSLANPDLVSNILLPSISAPGTNVLAAASVYSNGNAPQGLSYLSGTSMAAPHVAGAALLLKQLHPQWSVSEIQSALMLTADSQVTNSEGKTVSPWRQGAGMLDVAEADKVSLTMYQDADQFISADPRLGGEPETLNMPYLVNQQCFKHCKFTRTFKAEISGQWQLSLAESFPDDVKIEVTPKVFSLEAGEEVKVELSVQFAELSQVRSISNQLQLIEPNQQSLSLPILVKTLPAIVPDFVQLYSVSETGSRPVDPLKIADASNLNFSLSQWRSAQTHIFNLAVDSHPTGIIDASPFDDLQDGVATHFIEHSDANGEMDVIVARADNLDTDLIVGFDFNQDGIAQQDEAICYGVSQKNIGETCQLGQQGFGTYWLMVWNFASEQGNNIENNTIEIDLVEASAVSSDSGVIQVLPTREDGNIVSKLWVGSGQELSANSRHYAILTVASNADTVAEESFINSTKIQWNADTPRVVSVSKSSVSRDEDSLLRFDFSQFVSHSPKQVFVDIELAKGFVFADEDAAQQLENGVLLSSDEVSEIDVAIRLNELVSGPFVHQFTLVDSEGETLTSGSVIQLKRDEAPIIVSTVGDLESYQEGTQIQLIANVNDDSVTDIRYSWRQLAGPILKFTNTDENRVNLLLPQVSENSRVELVFEASDGAHTTEHIFVIHILDTSDKGTGGGAILWLIGILSLSFLLRKFRRFTAIDS